MKKIILLFTLLICVVESITAQYPRPVVYVQRSSPTQVVYRVKRNPVYVYETESSQKPSADKQIGVITRFGYSFAGEGYFDYGASLFYKFNSQFGIIVGVDGASKVSFKKESIKTIYKSTVGNISQWDVRGGVILGKYVGIGGIYGNCKVCTDKNTNLEIEGYNYKKNHIDNNIHDYGGFATILLPINKYIGLDIDVAYTAHTHFNIGGGLIISFPIK